MNTKNRSRIYALIAAICFASKAIMNFPPAVVAVMFVMDGSRFSLADIPFAFFTVVLFFLAITLVLQKPKAVFVAVIPCILYDIYCLVTDFCIGNFFWGVATSVFAAMVFSSISGKSDLKTIWFLPALFVLIASIVELSQFVFFLKYDLTFKYLSNYVLLFLAYFFAGLWLKSIVPPKAHSPSNRTSAQANTTAAQFKQYKDLLDSGAITEEEFQTKKKEKLGL